MYIYVYIYMYIYVYIMCIYMYIYIYILSFHSDLLAGLYLDIQIKSGANLDPLPFWATSKLHSEGKTLKTCPESAAFYMLHVTQTPHFQSWIRPFLHPKIVAFTTYQTLVTIRDRSLITGSWGGGGGLQTVGCVRVCGWVWEGGGVSTRNLKKRGWWRGQ